MADTTTGIKSRTANSDYVHSMTVKVPIRRITLNWKFGNTKKQFKKVQTNVTNDFKESKSGIQTG